MNEKIDDPINTASARVQSTCKVIAAAPETAKPPSATRRAAGVMITSGGSAAAPTPASSSPAEAAFSSSSSMLAGAASASRNTRRAIRIAAASVRLNPAAVTLVQRSPMLGRKMNPAKNEPATAPKRFTA